MAKKSSPTRASITAREAADSAGRYLTEIFGRVGEVMVEEVERSDDDLYWLITLSYRSFQPGSFMSREYKVFKLDSSNGEVRSMKIREV